MATYGQRDKFLQALVTFTVSDQAKEISPGDRQEMIIKIRDKYAPDISNEEWGEMAKGINDFKFVILDTVKYGEVPHIEEQLPKKDEVDYQETQSDTPHIDKPMEAETEEDNEVDEEELDDSEDNVDDLEEDNSDEEDEEGVSEEDNFEESEKPIEKEPEPEKPKTFGKFTKPKESKPKKVSTSRLRGLLKPKK